MNERSLLSSATRKIGISTYSSVGNEKWPWRNSARSEIPLGARLTRQRHFRNGHPVAAGA